MRPTLQLTCLFDCLPSKFRQVPTTQTQPVSSLSSLLDFCSKIEYLQQIHARFILYGLHQNPHLSSKLIDNYANIGHLDLSQQVFNSIKAPNASLYNTIIRNLCEFGKYEKTLILYQEMIMNSMYPDELTYPFVVKSCFHLSDIEYGRKVHGHVVKLGFNSDVPVSISLVDLYSNCGETGDAQEFDRISVNDLSYWNSLIYGSFQNGDTENCFLLFERMRLEGLQPDSVTVVNLLRSSVDLNSLETGRFVHALIVLSNLGGDLIVNTALLTMYSKLGSLETARLLFEKMPEKDCVVWNLMISAYSRNGCPVEALKLLIQMGTRGIRADLFTAIAAISSIGDMRSLQWGKQTHAHVIRNGLDYQVSVHNSLIEMYGKCEIVESARKIFDLLLNKSIISWSSMIKGYVNHGQYDEALSFFFKMRIEGFKVDSITVINILPACVNAGALETLQYLHGYSIKHGLNLVVSVVTAFLISYAKCGCIEMAQKLFSEEKIDSRDIVSWNSMISAYSKHGNWSQCFELYRQMKDMKLRPDRVTFLGLLTACVNSGFVKEGWECYKEMTETYGCQPNQEHYGCMVDLLGRAGHIKEALELIRTMPIDPDVRVWGPLLSACKKHSETRVAEFAAKKLIAMEPRNAGNYILLSNIYAAAGKWEGVAEMRAVLRDRGLKKTPGCSWLEINGNVHEFRVADQSHPKSVDIYNILRNLELEIKFDIDMNLDFEACTLHKV
ncbi:pentatricopeptide repeat-containing protein At4g19191, mitochondrial-like [Telopea speciosissima]|uniref:pentatricopeptide repeat-containing protein At4g19191, mitochondrial-like n=1 Tax=Telopea speciosissima TaxID=54955 RepID=UPI001CC6235E|nr:pentatricopeptide repeat-containing protein At4g19191, mitochondrial-like [Telopea speciosissima]